MHRTGVNSQAQLVHIREQLEYDFINRTTVAECSSILRAEASKLRTIIHEHHNHRHNERATQIAALNASGLPQDKAKAKVLRQLEVAEFISSVHRKIKTQMKQSVRERITRVEVPIDPLDNPRTCTQWKVVDVPSDVLDVLQKRNRVHFGQAHGSPFTIDPLVGTFGYGGTSLAARQVLNGNYDFDTITDTSVAVILKHLKQQTVRHQHAIRPEISLQAFVS